MNNIVAFLLLVAFSPLLLLVGILIKIDSKGPVLFWSKRVGRNSIVFLMPKFRTMYLGSPIVATDKLNNSTIHITRVGRLLRKTSLDELPQLYSVLLGQMHFIGPRPALYSQIDLIEMRKKYGIDHLHPGITGYAQVIGRDNISLEVKVRLDYYYLLNRNFKTNALIIFRTIIVVFSQKNITH